MQAKRVHQASCFVIGLLTAISPIAVSAAAALPASGQEQGTSSEQDRGPPPGQDQGSYDAVPEPPPPPADYDGTEPPPPPPGYPDNGYDAERYREADRRYEAYAEDWAARNCVKSQGNAAAGAVIGGIFGALLGSGLAGYHDRGAGAAIGGIAGAVGGAAIGSQQDNATSPGCPPGYVVRRGAPDFYYEGYGAPYYYYAPTWYRPWIFFDGRWVYRPYPYHDYYYHRYGPGHPGWGRPGPYGQPWRGGPGRPHGPGGYPHRR